MWIRQADRPTDDQILLLDISGTSQAVTVISDGLKDDRVREIVAFMGPEQTNLSKSVRRLKALFHSKSVAKSSRKDIVTDRDRLLADTTRQPLLLIYDYTRDCQIVPPKYTIGLLQDIYPGLTPKFPPTHPVIVPLVRVQTGKGLEHVPLTASKTSGELFGWTLGCEPPRDRARPLTPTELSTCPTPLGNIHCMAEKVRDSKRQTMQIRVSMGELEIGSKSLTMSPMKQRLAISKASPTRVVSANADRRVLPTLVDNVSDHPEDARPMVALLKQLSAEDRSWFAHPTVLILLLGRFDTSLPSPSQSLDAVLNYTEIIISALEGVTSALKSTQQTVLPEVMISWPAIWKWMIYLYQQHNATREVGPNAGRHGQYGGLSFDILPVIERAFALMVPPYMDPNPVIMSTPGALELSLKMWIRQADRPTHDPSLILDIESTSHAVGILFKLHLKADRVQEIVAFMGPEQSNLGKRLLDPLRAVIYRDPYLMDIYPKLIITYTVLVAQVPALLQDPRQIEETLSCIHHVLSRVPLSPLGMSHDKRETVNGSIYGSCGLLYNISHDVAQNAVWVLQFLQARLLECLVRTAPYHDNGMVHASVVVVLQQLRLYMLYRPIVKCFYQTMTSDAFVVLLAGMSQHQKFWSIWSYFEEIVRDAWTTQLEFKSSGLYKRKCGSAEVQYIPTTWPSTKALTNARNLVDYLTLPKTIAYFTYVVDKELKSSRKAIVTDRDRLLADITRQPLILIYDYARECKIVPPKYTIGLLQDIYPGLTPKLPPTHPVIIPLVRLQCGKRFEHVPLTASKTAGELFGWYVRGPIVSDGGDNRSGGIEAVPID
ncbi:hypothetical protein DXG01_011237 [Tephrocybe rancida]|nr:hypothetical protein DXG01_011237 [Tephrocybe rancida]